MGCVELGVSEVELLGAMQPVGGSMVVRFRKLMSTPNTASWVLKLRSLGRRGFPHDQHGQGEGTSVASNTRLPAAIMDMKLSDSQHEMKMMVVAAISQ